MTLSEKIHRDIKNLGNKKLSERQKEEMIDYKEFSEYTKVLKLGENVDCRIRLQETTFPDRPKELGVDVRKFLGGKYPYKGGRHGILIAADKWIPLLKKEVFFTMDTAEKDDWIALVQWINEITIKRYPEAFYQEPSPPPQAPSKKDDTSGLQNALNKKKILNAQNPEDINWNDFFQKNKKLTK